MAKDWLYDMIEINWWLRKRDLQRARRARLRRLAVRGMVVGLLLAGWAGVLLLVVNQ